MNKQLRRAAFIMLIILFFSPLLVTILVDSTLHSNLPTETKQYSTIGLVIMAIYNIPAVILSSVLVSISEFLSKAKYQMRIILLLTSLLVSIIGIGINIFWGFK